MDHGRSGAGRDLVSLTAEGDQPDSRIYGRRRSDLDDDTTLRCDNFFDDVVKHIESEAKKKKD